MSNPLTTLRSALWQTIDDDAELTALLLGGTKVRWAYGLQQRLAVEPAMCPILSVGPAEAHVPGIDAAGHDSRSEWRYSLRIQTYTEGQDADESEELIHRVIAVAAEHFPFGLGSQGLHAIEFDPVAFTIYPDERGRKPIWSASVQATARYRIS